MCSARWACASASKLRSPARRSRGWRAVWLDGGVSAFPDSPYLSRLAETHELGAPETLIVEAARTDDPAVLKARWALSWADRYLGGADFETLADWQTRFADATLERALALAWTEMGWRHEPAGLFVLGLGKLGGRDLNFSSDVDLVAFYDPERFPAPRAGGQGFEASRLLKAFTRLLHPPYATDFVWRVDWRLRPEASTRGLAMSTEAAAEFYPFRALPWHRLAMVKARVVAGDREAGARFLARLEPWLWRRNLDLRMIDELADIKTRLNAEHPGLKAERAAPAPITADPVGFNLKLGTGGIREIEFVANAGQLLWGGKQPALRTPRTWDALAELAQLGHLESDTAQDLVRIYKRLRHLENAVQMRLNAHTHILPEGAALAEVRALAGDDLAGLEADRRTVNAVFRQRVRTDGDAAPPLPAFVRDLDGEALRISEGWQAGFGEYGVREARVVKGLAGEVFAAVAESGLSPEAAIARLHRFFAQLSRSEQYLRLLAAHPALLDPLLVPLLTSPHMAALLEMSPHIVDVFVDPADSLDTGFIFASMDQEGRLEALRRFVNERLYLAYYRLMEARLSTVELQGELTRIAEAALAAALRIVADDLGMETLPVAVVGLGKLGLKEMMPLSDVDLLFLFPDATDGELAARIVRRLRTVLSAPMREGIAYELDMRLRPSGRAGPPAVKWSSFTEHHERRARNWEHLALSTARFVAGDAALGARAQGFIAAIVARPRDPDQLRADAARMWARIRDQRLRASPLGVFDARLRPGGLLQAEFALNTLRLMGRDGEMLGEAKRYFSDRLIWQRLLGLEGVREVPERFRDRVPGGRTAEMAARVEAATAELFGGVETAGEDEAVRWVERV